MKTFGLIILVVLTGCSILKPSIESNNSNKNNSENVNLEEFEDIITLFLNEERKNNNLESVIEDSLLTRTAINHTEEMIINDCFSLESKEGKSTNQIFLENAIYDNFIYPFIFRSKSIEKLIIKIRANNELRTSLIKADVNYFGISLLKNEEYFLTLYLVERYIFIDHFKILISMESSIEARTFLSEFGVKGKTKSEKLLLKLFEYSSYEDLEENKELLIKQIPNIENGNFEVQLNLKKYKYSDHPFLIRIYNANNKNVANIIFKK